MIEETLFKREMYILGKCLVVIQQTFYFQVKMNELDALRQEAETLKNAIRVSFHIISSHIAIN